MPPIAGLIGDAPDDIVDDAGVAKLLLPPAFARKVAEFTGTVRRSLILVLLTHTSRWFPGPSMPSRDDNCRMKYWTSINNL